jgi:hypothetical protein
LLFNYKNNRSKNAEGILNVTFHGEKNFSEKHSRMDAVDPALKSFILDRVEAGELSCKKAFDIADELTAPVGKIGKTIDLLNIKLIKCQLGLFGYKPKKKALKPLRAVDPDLKHAIMEALTEEKLSCRRAWEISSQFNVSKITVSSTCEYLGIKIGDCQLGAF